MSVPWPLPNFAMALALGDFIGSRMPTSMQFIISFFFAIAVVVSSCLASGGGLLSNFLHDECHVFDLVDIASLFGNPFFLPHRPLKLALVGLRLQLPVEFHHVVDLVLQLFDLLPIFLLLAHCLLLPFQLVDPVCLVRILSLQLQNFNVGLQLFVLLLQVCDPFPHFLYGMFVDQALFSEAGHAFPQLPHLILLFSDNLSGARSQRFGEVPFMVTGIGCPHLTFLFGESPLHSGSLALHCAQHILRHYQAQSNIFVCLILGAFPQ